MCVYVCERERERERAGIHPPCGAPCGAHRTPSSSLLRLALEAIYIYDMIYTLLSTGTAGQFEWSLMSLLMEIIKLPAK